jgi:hypothetical protein
LLIYIPIEVCPVHSKSLFLCSIAHARRHPNIDEVRGDSIYVWGSKITRDLQRWEEANIGGANDCYWLSYDLLEREALYWNEGEVIATRCHPREGVITITHFQ